VKAITTHASKNRVVALRVTRITGDRVDCIVTPDLHGR
jgi:hypothetical protein